MRIGFFTDSYFPRKDGTSYTIQTWKNRLEERGHEVHLYYPESPHQPGENEHPQNAVYDPFYHGHFWPLPDLSDLRDDLDVVHCHGPWLVSYKGVRYSREHEVPSVYTYHTPIQEYVSGFLGKTLARIVVPVVDFFDRWWLGQFDRVTCSDDAIPVDVEYEELPVGVDSEFFSPRDDQPFEMPESPVIGYSGRISEEKNLEELVQLAEKSDVNLVIVGNGRYRKELEEKAPGSVEFHDFLPREDLPKFYSALDAFVTASTSDTFSLTTMEANLCGTPVLAPDTSPFTTTIQDENGEKYAPGEIEDMREKLEKVLNGSYDTREAAMRFEVSKTIDRLEEMYEEIS